jgi:glutamate decarboxylase
VPVVCLALRNAHARAYTVFDVAERLREFGWMVPAYALPDDASDVKVLRIVVREGFSRTSADKLLADLTATLSKLDAAASAPQQHGHPRC